jgi:hypothetical protein
MFLLKSSTLRVAVLGSLLACTGFAQPTPAPKAPAAPRIDFPQPSQTATLEQRVGLTDIEVVYARPSARGRKVFGGLVPYGEVWRTGANTSTKITFSTAVKFGTQELPAGSYALFSIPGDREWTVIFNKVVGEWGAYTYKPDNDALRVKVSSAPLAEAVESFEIDISDIATESATLNLAWEKTRVPVKFQVDAVKPVVAQIEAAMASGATLPANVYFSSALFYLDNNLDLNKAKTWVDEATKGPNPPFYMLYHKARILAKLGDKAGATATARQSIAAAQGATKDEYTRLNEALIASLK